MSVIQTIRNKYGKIAGGIIAIALIGFIVSDARNGSFGSFFGSHDNSIMIVNGTKIDPKVYQARIREFEILYGNGRNIDDATRAQMDEQAIQTIAVETAIEEQCDKLGIQTSDEEKKELIYGPNVAREVHDFEIQGQHVFNNPQTGQFDPGYIKAMEKQLQDNSQKIDPEGKLREKWEAVKTKVLRESRINKYKILFAGSIYEPIYMAKRAFTDQNAKAAIKYVKVPFSYITDNDVKVTDEDIKDFMQKHPGFFQVDQPTRSIEYVSFDIIPSSSDTAKTLDALAQVKEEFATTKDIKTFVNNKSDEANSYYDGYVNKRMFTSRFADTIMGQAEGSIFGPYYENGGYRLTKVMDKKTLPDSVKCRYILVVTKNKGTDIMSDSMAKEKIDSAIMAIKSGAPFDSMVNKYSDDDKSKGGENTFVLQQKTTLPKNLSDFIFNGKKGETKVVNDSTAGFSGYFYVEIMDQQGIAPAIQMATITKNLTPSDSTVNAIYAKANEFAGKNVTGAEFDAAVKKQILDKRIGDNLKMSDFTIPGIGPAREVIKWAFDHKPGEVSGVIQLGDQRYLVAKMATVQDKGIMALTPGIRQQIEQRVRDEKKADAISKKFAGSASLDAIASATNNTVTENDSVTLNASYISGLGYEPKVVGYTFYPGFQPNTVSPGIKGTGGVYFITVISRSNQPIDTSNPGLIQMLSSQSRMMEMQERNTLMQSLQQAIIKKSDIKYNYQNF